MKTFLLKSSLLILILVLGLRSPGLCQGQASVFSQEWPQFRGPKATGILDGANIPVSWDLETGENVLWKTPIPGLGHSCPVIWGDKIFVTTAISATGNGSGITWRRKGCRKPNGIPSHPMRIRPRQRMENTWWFSSDRRDCFVLTSTASCFGKKTWESYGLVRTRRTVLNGG